MDRGTWQTTVHGAAKRVGHNLASKQQQQQQVMLVSVKSWEAVI